MSGLRFGTAASIDTNGTLIRSALYQDQGAWLDNAANLAGGLVLRRPDGAAVMHIATNGTVRVRKSAIPRMGAM